MKSFVLKTQGLVDLGILNGDVDTLIEQQAYRQTFICMELGHWLGLDVHDCRLAMAKINNGYSKSVWSLLLSLVFNISEDADVPEQYKGIWRAALRIIYS